MVVNRKKKTLIDQTLPPFSQREPDPRAVEWYVDLAGHECELEIGESVVDGRDLQLFCLAPKSVCARTLGQAISHSPTG
jgi:hypothetical protein